MSYTEDDLRAFIKTDPICYGVKIDDQAIKHLLHLLTNFTHIYPIAAKAAAIRFYVQGYIAGVQSRS